MRTWPLPLAVMVMAGSSWGQTAPAVPEPSIRYEAMNPTQRGGDRLADARRIAASVVAQDRPAPRLIVDVGSFTGEFLEAFMQRFPAAHGQWTEPVATNRPVAQRRLARFGDRVDYVIGCPSRDLAAGCVPKGVDVLITSWLSIHQDLPGVRRFYREAAAALPSGGWLVNLDHVTPPGPWRDRLRTARTDTTASGITAMSEGPPVHHPDFVTPSLADQLAAFHAAGIEDVQVVWSRLDTVLLMGRKP